MKKRLARLNKKGMEEFMVWLILGLLAVLVSIAFIYYYFTPNAGEALDIFFRRR